jgi:hypothetical protein
MLEGCVEPIARVGALLVFLFADAAVVTSRRGIRLIVIGVGFSWLPVVCEVASKWIVG